MNGRHLLADFFGVEPARLTSQELLSECLLSAARECSLTPVAGPVFHTFPGGGITGVLLLAESHISLHTYPEGGYVAVDVFTCGRVDPRAALTPFRRAFSPRQDRVTVVPRGADNAHGCANAG